jgi:hypothetical protein
MPTQTYTPIARQVLNGTTSVDFTSISSTYTDLVLIGSLIQSGSAINSFMRVGNGTVDTGSNYSQTILYGNGTSAVSTRVSSQTAFYADIAGAPGTGSDYNVVTYSLQNYSNTTTNKTVLMRASKATNGTDAIVGLWRSTSAINRISLYSSNALTGTFTLYGIKAGS